MPPPTTALLSAIAVCRTVIAMDDYEALLQQGCSEAELVGSDYVHNDEEALLQTRTVDSDALLQGTPTLSPTCADVGNPPNVMLDDSGFCPAWVNGSAVNSQDRCEKPWAQTACPRSCAICELCTLGEWTDWSDCSSSCNGGGRYRTRGSGDCGADYEYTESEQCNTESCIAAACDLTSKSRLVITEDNHVEENVQIIIDDDDPAPAIFVYNAANVVLRNIEIVHKGHARVKGYDPALDDLYVDQSGAGIFFQNSRNISIESVHVSLVRPEPNPFAAHGDCATEYCGPFSYDMIYAYNIYGQDSDAPRLSNVYVTGGSTGFWCKNCPDGRVSHYKAENLHGPFPRGQCFQVVSSSGFILEDFTCIQDNEKAFPEDDISVWNSSNALVRRGFIQGNNAPNGVGVIFEMSDNGMCQDVDVTMVGGTQFSAYGSDNVTFLRTRAKNNQGTGTCLDGRGYCLDSNGTWPNSQTYAGDQSVPDKTCCGEEALSRCDTNGGVWFAGDYTSDQAGGAFDHQASNIVVKQGVFYDMFRIEAEESYSNVGTCVEITDSDWATSAANRQEAYLGKDFSWEDFTLRVPFTPTFCWESWSNWR